MVWSLCSTGMAYRARLVDQEVGAALAALGAVIVEGPKACGKTETSRQHAASEVLLDVDVEARQAAEIDPRLVLSGARPRLVDEWQVVPGVWNAVRRAVDDARQPGQFLLTGSATPTDDITRHSGAGRFARVRMRPMSTAEQPLGSQQISLGSLLDGEGSSAPDAGIAVPDVAEAIVRGGWPGWVTADLAVARRANRSYVDQLRRTDVPAVGGRRHDPERVGRLMRSLARHVGTQASVASIVKDTFGPDGVALDRETVTEYLDALARLMVVEDLRAYRPHLRSRYELRTSPTRHLVDPSVAAAVLNASPEDLLGDLRTFGLWFESLVVRDVRTYAEGQDATVSHYRDERGLEVDVVVTRRDGAWLAAEVKLGVNQIDDAATNLLRFAADVVSDTPPILAVITATGYGYVRPDGVHVVPFSALTA